MGLQKPLQYFYAASLLVAATTSTGPVHAEDWQTTVTRTSARIEVAPTAPRLTGRGHLLSGAASYYWQGQMTASGERFDKTAMTAAHRTLPFGTRVKVTRADTGKSVVVRINDRGPFTKGRVIDLSEKAAQELRMTGRGTAPVKIEVLQR